MTYTNEELTALENHLGKMVGLLKRLVEAHDKQLDNLEKRVKELEK